LVVQTVGGMPMRGCKPCSFFLRPAAGAARVIDRYEGTLRGKPVAAASGLGRGRIERRILSLPGLRPLTLYLITQSAVTVSLLVNASVVHVQPS